MKNIKTFKQFKEAFTITLDKLPVIGDMVDKVDWKEGEKFAFIDFKGIKNIPVSIEDNTLQDSELESELEIEEV